MATDRAFTHAVIEVFKEALEREGVSYRDIENRSGINRGTISRRLSGNHSITVDALMELCAGAGLDAGAILRDAYKRL
jgi:transcriptional regulator with XRE-family HTH domain